MRQRASRTFGGAISPNHCGAMFGYFSEEGHMFAGGLVTVFVTRAHLSDPYWTRHAAWMLGYPLPWPDPYKSLERYTPRFEFRFSGDKS